MSGSDYRHTESDTARVSASEQDKAHRAEREATALRYLDRNDLGDIAVILGLRPELCANGCGAEAVRMGHCDAAECKRALVRTARKVSAGAYDKARMSGR